MSACLSVLGARPIGDRRSTIDERRTTNDERRTTNDERRTTILERSGVRYPVPLSLSLTDPTRPYVYVATRGAS